MQPAPEATLSLSQSRGRLLRILGVGFGLAVTIGNTIAAGIVRTPGEIAAELQNGWLFIGVWIAGGLYALLGAICVAELGTMIPRSGGQYVFARRALGEYPGFIVGWSDWLSTCGTAAAVAFVIGEYTGALVPSLGNRTVLIATLVVIAFAAVQWRGLRWGSNTQNVTSLLKALAFLALVAACFLFGGRSLVGGSTAPAIPTGLPLFFALVLALQSVIYTYDGWAGPVYFSEEVENPERNILRSLLGGVLSVMGIYLLVNLALVYVLPMSRIAGEKFAMGLAAQAISGAYGDTIVRVVMILSMLSGINAYHLMATRVLFAMSRDGLFSDRAVKVNEGGTPTISLFVSLAVAVLFILLSGTFKKIIDALAFFFVANYTMSFLSVFVLRRREPDTPRPYHAWGHPWTTGVALVGSVVFLAGAIASDIKTGQSSSIYAFGLLVASYPLYRILKQQAGGRVPG